MLWSVGADVADISCLPMLNIENINRKSKTFALQHNHVDREIPVQKRVTSTNGVNYTRLVQLFDSQILSSPSLSLLPLYTSVRCVLRTQLMF